MDYDNYEGAIVVRLGVQLVAWTHSTWACPSQLPLEAEPLETLLEAVKTGQCHFRRLTAAERVQCVDEHMEHLVRRSHEQRRRRNRRTHRSGN